MVDQKKTNVISIRRQCQALGLNRSSYYYHPQEESPENLDIMRRMDELYLRYPFYGSRKMVYALEQQGVLVCRDRIRRLMKLMGSPLPKAEDKSEKPRTQDISVPVKESDD